MATQSGLVRSFYGWLVRRERDLKEAGNSVHLQMLPVQRPTSLPAVATVAIAVEAALQDTEYAARASYWAELFQGIQAQGWHGDMRPEDVTRDRIRKELEEAIRA